MREKHMVKKKRKNAKNGQWDARVAVYMSEELYATLKEEAWYANMKESAFLRNLYVKYLEKKK
jgi:hypothetical protein